MVEACCGLLFEWIHIISKCEVREFKDNNMVKLRLLS